MKLTPQEIESVAVLARLSLTETEKTMYAEQLSAVLEYVERLGEVDTDQVPETCQVTGLEDVTREDKVRDCEPGIRQKLIAAFPENDGNYLKVKAVFEG